MSDPLETTPDSDEARRQRLRARGWHPAAGTLFSQRMWRSPAGRIVTEPEAFDQLVREERREAAP